MSDAPIAPVQIDVGGLVRRSVATLYSHLVTRPTGRAVRLAIETQLAEAGETSCSLIDLSEVSVLDFSCADEVVAKLLARYLGEDRPRDAFFVFRGVVDHHREPVEAVLERQGLAAVAHSGSRCELLGVRTGLEEGVWSLVEERGRLSNGDIPEVLRRQRDRETLDVLVRRRLVFRSPGGDVHALSRFVGDLPRG
jgi:hypothetical protein